MYADAKTQHHDVAHERRTGQVTASHQEEAMSVDNGDTGGQSARSSDANKLTLCSPVRPAQHISLVMHRWSDEDVADFRSHDPTGWSPEKHMP